MRKLALTLAACGILLGSTSRAEAASVCTEGRGETPRLHSADDRRSHAQVSLSNFRGKKVLLIQFASW